MGIPRSSVELVERGREALRSRSWKSAYECLVPVKDKGELDAADYEGLALASMLMGKEAEQVEFLTRAHQANVAAGDVPKAARCATWLGFYALNNGDLAQAGGWLARAQRLLEEHGEDCVERGYVLIPTAIRKFREREPHGVQEMFAEAAEIARRYRDADLLTLALVGLGRSAIVRGEVAKGMSLLDEAMVAVTSGEASAVVTGGVYCTVLDACSEIFDLRRAREWTTALEQWCASQPEAVPFRGLCLIRRSEIMQLQGKWVHALEQAHMARERLAQPPPKAAMSVALYQIAELHRLRGEFAEAEKTYRSVSQAGRSPQPGFALLRLAQGQTQAACAAIRQAMEDVREPGRRAVVLDAAVEIAIAAGEIEGARAASDELSAIAKKLQAPLLLAMADRAAGAVLLAAKDARGAVPRLRKAFERFLEIDAPYEAAKVRVLLGLACRELGNADGAVLEFEAAAKAFEQMGAAHEVERVSEILRWKDPVGDSPLTERETEVLKLVATGMTNRKIATKLRISEKTVARHVSNIFTKLDLNSRAAATAYAYRRQLL